MKYVKKHWFIFTIMILCFIRLLISYNLISFYIGSLSYDDVLMIRESNSILNGNYLGVYNNMTLIKGPIFPLFLALVKTIRIPFPLSISILYIISSLFFLFSLKKIIKEKKILIIIFALIIFHPVTLSSELSQRIYRNCLSIPELLFFLGCIINVLFSNKHKILNNVSLGLIVSIMILTREDTIWTYVILIFMYGYKLIKYLKEKEKTNIVLFLINLFPIFIIIINLNIMSLINYNHYNIYTYNELNDSYFKKAYSKILEIKDEEKIDKVAIPKSTFYKIADNVKIMNIDRNVIDNFYEIFEDENGEINNGNMVWYFRNLVNYKNKFKDGKEASKFYKKLCIEMDDLFDKGVFKKEAVLPSTYLYMPTKNEFQELPKDILRSIFYTSSYSQVKTLSKSDIKSYSNQKYDNNEKAYSIVYKDYRNSANIPKNNPIILELIKTFFKYFTIILSPLALYIYFKNIKSSDYVSILLHIILLSYLIIIFGISYNNTTAFPSIRYSYLSNIYILQNLFIVLNIYRMHKKKKD